MPPTVKPPPAPKGWDDMEAVVAWLGYYGILDTIPTLRSSDYELCLRNPFLYLLVRRFGIVPRLKWSKALNRGSWFHIALEQDKFDGGGPGPVDTLLANRLAELREICRSMGITSTEGIQRILDREERDAKSAWGWYNTALDLPLPKDYRGSARGYLSGDFWRPLASEVNLSCVAKDHARLNRVIQIDKLMLDDKHRLWIVDAKTTGLYADERLQLCPEEFQTQHYLFTLNDCLPQVIKKFDLHPDTHVGGMIHWAVQKPTIDFGMKDCPYEEYEHVLKSGPRKGQTEMRRRKLSTEPSLDNYVKRCDRWARGKGEYLDKREEREAHPCSNLSFTPWSEINTPHYQNQYQSRVDHLAQYALGPLDFSKFPRSIASLQSMGKLSPYTPFFLVPPAKWPSIMAQDGFMVAHRDEVVETDDA